MSSRASPGGKSQALVEIGEYQQKVVPKKSSRHDLRRHLRDFKFRLADDLHHDHPLRHPKATNWRSAQSVIALFKKHKELSYNEQYATTSLKLIEENEAYERENRDMRDKIEVLDMETIAWS